MTGTKTKKKLLSPAEIDEAIDELAATARRDGVKIALIGGVALQKHGSDRLTSDVDIIEHKYESIDLPIGKAFDFGGRRTHTSKGVTVDVIARSDEFASVYEEALNSAENIPGIPIPVVQPEYIFVMKMIASRKKDEADMELVLVDGIVDIEKTRSLVTRFLGAYGRRQFDKFVSDVAWSHKNDDG